MLRLPYVLWWDCVSLLDLEAERELIDKRKQQRASTSEYGADFSVKLCDRIMTSKVSIHDNYVSTAPSVEPSASDTAKPKRQATVYDAVAGRISAAGFIPEIPIIAASRDTASSSVLPVAPEEVLFRRKNAPVRYEETDFYFASDQLPSNALPDCDLLKALHCYASDFYSRATIDRGQGDWRSMDETALLAMGILLEEICRETLGAKGDLVFTEGELRHESAQGSASQREELSAVRSSVAAVRSGRTRTRKKRRYNSDAPPIEQ